MNKRIFSFSMFLLVLVASFSFTLPYNMTAQAEDVLVYVNGEAETNGDGTLALPYNTLTNAINAVKSGGTVVVTGRTDIKGCTFTNTGKVTLTSHDGTTDFRGTVTTATGVVTGGYIVNSETAGSPHYAKGGTGEIAFENINLVWNCNNSGICLYGRPLTLGTGTAWYEVLKNGDISSLRVESTENIRLYDISSSGTETDTDVTKTTVESGAAITKIIVGSRRATSTVGHDITIDGSVGTLFVSCENNKNTSGKLTVNGDVRVTIGDGGTLGNLTVATAPSNSTTGLAGVQLLDKITGTLAVIVEHGGTLTKNGIVTSGAGYTIGKFAVVKASEGISVAHGQNSGEFVVTASDADESSISAIEESGRIYTLSLDEAGSATFAPSASGTYTLTYGEKEAYTLSYVDSTGGNVLDDYRVAKDATAALTVTLPTLANAGGKLFLGWSQDNASATAQYKGGDSFTLSSDTTLYAVWESAPTYTVTFKDADGNTIGTYTDEADTPIKVYPEIPFRVGYTFRMWSADGITPITTVPKGDTAATAYYDVEPRKVVFLNGSATSAGDGTTPDKPVTTIANALSSLSDNGGVVVVMGVTALSGGATDKDILFTSKYDGVDYRGSLGEDLSLDGAYLLHNSGSPFGFSAGTGTFTFDDINMLFRTQYNAINFSGHPFNLGKGVTIYEPTTNSTTCETFRLSTTLSLRSYDISSGTKEETQILTSFIDGGVTYNNHYLGTRGETVIPGRNIVIGGKLSNLCISTDIKNVNQGQLTVNGDIKVTLLENAYLSEVKAQTAKDSATGTTKSGLDSFKGNLSIVVNNGASLGKVADEVKPGNGKYVLLNVGEGGVVTHTDGSLEYEAYTYNPDTYNCVTVTDENENSTEYIMSNGACTFRVSDEGAYDVSFSKVDLYKVTYTDELFANEFPSYSVRPENTSALTITLPDIKNTNTHYFLGWSDDPSAVTADYEGGSQYTISGSIDLYAVWKLVPTYTVTFKDENESLLGTFEAYEGTDIVFPDTTDLHKHGYIIVGWAQKDSEVLVTKVPSTGDVTLYPVYEERTGKDRVFYLNGTAAENGNGLTPETAFNHIQSAIDAVKDDGGTVVVTGPTSFRNSTVSPQISPSYNNAGDIVFTSYDRNTDTDYRATYNSTSKTLDGAYIYYTNGMNFGSTVMTGKITFEYCTLVKAKATYINFYGHPYEIGEGVSVYKGSDTFEVSTLQMRGMGESDGVTSNPDGIVGVLNGLRVGDMEHHTGGAASATVAGLDLTIDSDVDYTVSLGANSGTLTVAGDIFITLNAPVDKWSTSKFLHESGNVTIIENYGIDSGLDLIAPDGYKTRVVRCDDDFAVLSHGKDASEINVVTQPTVYSFVELYNDGTLCDTVKLDENYSATLTLPDGGNYTVGFTNDPAFSVTFDTGCDVTIEREWHDPAVDFTVRGGVRNVGYLFAGWEYDGEILNEGDIMTMPYENIVFTAVWEPAPTITLTLDNNGYGKKPANIANFIYETSALPVLSDANAHFIGWADSKDANVGVINYTHLENKTLYAVWSDAPASYSVHIRYSLADNGYVAEVYANGEVNAGMEGEFAVKVSDELAYSGITEAYGVTAEASSASNISVTWQAEKMPYDTETKRHLFTLEFASEGELSTIPESLIYATSAQSIDGQPTLTKASDYKSDITLYGTVAGMMVLGAREGQTLAKTPAMLYVYNDDGDICLTKLLENTGDTEGNASFEVTLPVGDYVLRIAKTGYIHRQIPVTVVEGTLEISDIPVFGGDTADETGLGDGIVDIDDFVRILRGFAAENKGNTQFIKRVDINEDGILNVSDISIVKQSMAIKLAFENLSVYAASAELEESASDVADVIGKAFDTNVTVSDTAPEKGVILALDENMKLKDWTVTTQGKKVITITGGSIQAVIHGAETVASISLDAGTNAVSIPTSMAFEYPYSVGSAVIAGNELCSYIIVAPADDPYAATAAGIITDYLAANYGFNIAVTEQIVDNTDNMILIGKASPLSDNMGKEECLIAVDANTVHIAYEQGSEYAPEIAAYDFIEQVISPYNSAYDKASDTLILEDGYEYADKDEIGSYFLLMSDTHVESDFLENGRDVYTMWKPGFEALNTTYEYVNDNFPDLDFALFVGDQLNTGYLYQPTALADELDNYYETLENLDIYKDTKLTADGNGEIPTTWEDYFEFTKGGSYVQNGKTLSPMTLDSKVIAIQGNHDTGVPDYYRECAFVNGNTKYICFFASYVSLPAPEGQYMSTGKISDEAIEFIENELEKTVNDDRIDHIILACHWAIASEFHWPILDACPENGYSNNRQKLLDLAEQYGADFYINGHEHNPAYPVAKAGILSNINVGSTTSRWATVEIHTRKAVFDIYSTAVANITTGEIISQPEFISTKTVDLTPRSILVRGKS